MNYQKLSSHAPGSGLNLTDLEDLSGLRPRALPMASPPKIWISNVRGLSRSHAPALEWEESSVLETPSHLDQSRL